VRRRDREALVVCYNARARLNRNRCWNKRTDVPRARGTGIPVYVVFFASVHKQGD